MYENQKTLECVQTKMFSAYGEKVHRGKIQLECRHEETSIKYSWMRQTLIQNYLQAILMPNSDYKNFIC